MDRARARGGARAAPAVPAPQAVRGPALRASAAPVAGARAGGRARGRAVGRRVPAGRVRGDPQERLRAPDGGGQGLQRRAAGRVVPPRRARLRGEPRRELEFARGSGVRFGVLFSRRAVGDGAKARQRGPYGRDGGAHAASAVARRRRRIGARVRRRARSDPKREETQNLGRAAPRALDARRAASHRGVRARAGALRLRRDRDRVRRDVDAQGARGDRRRERTGGARGGGVSVPRRHLRGRARARRRRRRAARGRCARERTWCAEEGPQETTRGDGARGERGEARGASASQDTRARELKRRRRDARLRARAVLRKTETETARGAAIGRVQRARRREDRRSERPRPGCDRGHDAVRAEGRPGRRGAGHRPPAVGGAGGGRRRRRRRRRPPPRRATAARGG